MTTKQVAQICGVTEKTVYNNAIKANVVLEHGKAKEWSEDELKRLQLVLMKNQVNQGVQVETIKSTVENDFQSGLTFQEIVNSGNIEAMKELTTLAMNACAEVARNKELEAQNQLLLEQKEAAEAETARIYQCNKNFHSNLYTASQIGQELGITANMVGRIANENGLKQDPIYGKLGKIQLNNGQWVNQFYYNNDALTVIESIIG
jgi:DNA-binding transcriptional MerR regulator